MAHEFKIKNGLLVSGSITGITENSSENSAKMASTAWVRSYVGASANGSLKTTQSFTATANQTTFTIPGGYGIGLIDVYVNGSYLNSDSYTASNGTTVILTDAASLADIIDVVVYSPLSQGFVVTSDQITEGLVNKYFTEVRARGAISLTTTGVSGPATYNNLTGVFNIPNYQGLVPANGTTGQILAKASNTSYDTAWIDNFTSRVEHTVKLGETMTVGTPVYVPIAQDAGTNMTVLKASNASEATSSKTMGLISSGGSPGDFVQVITEGLLTGLDTSSATKGDPVWLGVNGALIFGLANKPVAPAHLVFIGIVTRAQAINGEIFVKVQNGFELEELHNVAISSAANNQGLFYESATSLWKNKTIAAALGYTPVDASLTANYVPKATGATTLANSNIQDDGSLITLGSNTTISSGSLGIGTTSLTGYNLRVSKNITGATVALGIVVDGTIQSDVTSQAYGFRSALTTAAATFTLIDLFQFRAQNTTIGSGSTVTNQYGFAVSDLTSATNNYGFFGAIPAGTNRWNIYMNTTANNYLAGSLGIGTTTLTGVNLNVVKNITGAVNSNNIQSAGAVQSDVTTAANYYSTFASTQATTFTLANLRHFYASQGTFGAGSTITNQFGFIVESNLIGATNNYGFYGNIAAATGRWNLYMNGTANNYLAGSLGIGSTTLTGINLRVGKFITGSVSSHGIFQDGMVQSDVTSDAYGFRNTINTQAASFTLTNYWHFTARQATIGAGSVVTSQQGFHADSTLIGATNNYGFRGSIPVGTNRWNLYMDGTANNYLAGGLGIGSTSVGNGINLNMAKTMTGATTQWNIYNQSQIQSDVTTLADYFRTNATTQAATFTLPSLVHYRAFQGTFGAGSIVTNQYGFFADSTLTGATNDYGFYGNLAAASNVWNLYMAGTAANYMAGQLLIGTTTTSAYALDVATGGINGIAEVARFSSIGNGGSNRGVGIIISAPGSANTVSVVRLVGYQESTSTTANNASFAIQVANSSGTLTEHLRINNVGGVGIGVSSINASAKVQIDSTTQGFLPPRMTSAQRTAISTPATGLIVYQTDGVEGLYIKTATSWKTLVVT